MTVNYKFRCLETLKIVSMKQDRDYLFGREVKLNASNFSITTCIDRKLKSVFLADFGKCVKTSYIKTTPMQLQCL